MKMFAGGTQFRTRRSAFNNKIIVQFRTTQNHKIAYATILNLASTSAASTM